MIEDKIMNCISLVDEVKINEATAASNKTLADNNELFFTAYNELLIPLLCSYILSKKYPAIKFTDEAISSLKDCLIQTRDIFDAKTIQNAKQYRTTVKSLNAALKASWEQSMSEHNLPYRSELASLKLVARNKSEISNCLIAVSKIETWPISNAAVTYYQKALAQIKNLRSSMNLDATIDQFLKNISSGTVTLADLSPEILKWIHDHHLEENFKVSVIQA